MNFEMVEQMSRNRFDNFLDGICHVCGPEIRAAESKSNLKVVSHSAWVMEVEERLVRAEARKIQPDHDNSGIERGQHCGIGALVKDIEIAHVGLGRDGRWRPDGPASVGAVLAPDEIKTRLVNHRWVCLLVLLVAMAAVNGTISLGASPIAAALVLT